MITRKLGKILRGNATPFQIVAATTLGSLIAFVPGFSQAPGLLILWVALLVVLNANLFLAGLTGLVAKLVALVLTPVSFFLGRVLLEGPTRGLFTSLVNGPVTAWFGLDYYVVAGGALLGLVLGLAGGLALVVVLRRTWTRLAALEGGSEAYKAWTSKRSVKIFAWIFIGGVTAQESYEKLLARRFGNPVRPLGAVLVVLLGVLGWVGAQFLDGMIVTIALRSGLERVNGATVDLETVDVSLREGRVAITGLAMADPDRLDTNLFAARSIEATLSTGDLLRRRAVIDSVVVTGATQGDRRAVPGVRIAPPPEEPAGEWKWPEMLSIDQILENADVWRERLQTARRWLDRMQSEAPADGAPAPAGDDAPPVLTFEELLRERVRALGYANVRDETLVEKAPRLLIRLIAADAVQAAAFPDDPLDIRARHLASEPHLSPEPASLSVVSRSGRLQSALTAPAGAPPQLEFLLKALPVDEMVAKVKASSRPALKGGTFDLALNGTLGVDRLDLPLTLTVRGSELAVGGRSTPLDNLPLTGRVRGTLTHPAISIDAQAWQNALVSSAKGEAKRLLEAELQKKLGASGEGEKADELKKAAGSLLEGLRAPKN